MVEENIQGKSVTLFLHFVYNGDMTAERVVLYTELHVLRRLCAQKITVKVKFIKNVIKE